MKSTVIECPECAGHGGEGVYCEDCLSTGRITVYGPPAEAIDQLRADLAAERQRAEAAEKDANELRSDNEMNAHYAARALHAEAERDQLLSHLADADQSSMERIAKIDALEAALAAVPVESLCRIFDAWRMRGQALQYDMDAAFAWLSRAKVRP